MKGLPRYPATTLTPPAKGAQGVRAKAPPAAKAAGTATVDSLRSIRREAERAMLPRAGRIVSSRPEGMDGGMTIGRLRPTGRGRVTAAAAAGVADGKQVNHYDDHQ